MATVATEPAPPRKRRFTVDEYYRMADAGVFSQKDRVELIDGHIYTMSPIGSEHAACVRRLTRLLIRRAESQAIVSTQSPIRLDDASEPEPDLALLKPREDDYAARHPRPDEVMLVIEVADTSVTFDREVKRPLYAEADIPECWIVHLEEERVEVYHTPHDNHYADEQQYERGQTIPLQALPELDAVAVEDILGTAD